MKISLPLVSLVFGLACAVLLVGHAEGRIGKETKITVEFSKNPFSFSVRPISNPFYNLVRTNGRKLTAETTTPAANTEDDEDEAEGPPTCTTTADCDHLYGYPGLPNGTSFECSNGMIYGYPNGNVCGNADGPRTEPQLRSTDRFLGTNTTVLETKRHEDGQPEATEGENCFKPRGFAI